MQLCLRDAFDRKQKYKSSKFLSFFFFFFLISYSIISNSDTERIKNLLKREKETKKQESFQQPIRGNESLEI